MRWALPLALFGVMAVGIDLWSAWDLHGPRVLTGALVGAMLALSGAILQAITRNALADPALIGISQGAALAVIVSIVALPGVALEWRPALAFAGGTVVAVTVQMLAQGGKGHAPLRLILIGIGIAAFLSSISAALLSHGNIERAGAALVWLAGALHQADWTVTITLATIFAILIPVVALLSRWLVALTLGPDIALGLGVSVAWVQGGLLLVAVGLAASVVALVGPFGFIALIAPHMARRLVGRAAGLLPVAALCGACLVVVADLIGRTLFAPLQIPAGLVTALIGAPTMVWLMTRKGPRCDTA